jgi:hypothetical protein
MARTFIEAQAQNANGLLTEPEKLEQFSYGNSTPEEMGYITTDNISTDLVQYRTVKDNEIFSLGTLHTAYKYIIQGDGVNGKTIDVYPTGPAESLGFGAGYSLPQANVSEIFTYLNAGGSNVKYTKFSYNYRLYNIDRYVNPNTRGQGVEYSRSVRVVRTTTIEIYWGKYVKIDYTNLGSTIGSFVGSGFFDISSLSGIYNAGHYYTYPQINLDTRKIIGLPRPYINGDVNGQKLVDHFWSVETDDFATTVTAPTPQETTEEVSGTKISELPSTTTLQDDDLLVISRDEESDGSFDASYNTSLSDLAAKISSDMPLNANFYDSGWVSATASTETAFNHNLGRSDFIVQVFFSTSSSGNNAALVGDILDSSGNKYGARVKSISASSLVVQTGYSATTSQWESGTEWNGNYIRVIALSETSI